MSQKLNRRTRQELKKLERAVEKELKPPKSKKKGFGHAPVPTEPLPEVSQILEEVLSANTQLSEPEQQVFNALFSPLFKGVDSTTQPAQTTSDSCDEVADTEPVEVPISEVSPESTWADLLDPQSTDQDLIELLEVQFQSTRLLVDQFKDCQPSIVWRNHPAQVGKLNLRLNQIEAILKSLAEILKQDQTPVADANQQAEPALTTGCYPSNTLSFLRRSNPRNSQKK